MVKVNLGSGKDYRDGYINIDNGSIFNTKRDITADIFYYDMPLDSVDEILLSHLVMYIRPDEMEILLKRWYGWLKSGGKIEIETIDIEKVMVYALNPIEDKRVDSWGFTNIFGTEETGPHRWGWRADILEEKLKKVGFSSITKTFGDKNPNRDYKLIAIK